MSRGYAWKKATDGLFDPVLNTGMETKPMYKIEELQVVVGPDEILDLMKRVEGEDMFGEVRSSLLSFLPYEYAKPYLRDDVTEDEWTKATEDVSLQSDLEHYADWWRSKIVDERGISCWRGKVQFAVRMALAGIPEWEEVWQLEGDYDADAYNRATEIIEDLKPLQGVGQ